MRIHEFEAGSTLVVLIMTKRSWPKKDLEVARGMLLLNEDIFPRRTVEEEVDVFLPANDGESPRRYGDEHMASIHVKIDFVVPVFMLNSEDKRTRRRAKPEVWREGDNEDATCTEGAASSSAPAANSARRARPRTLADEQEQASSEDESDQSEDSLRTGNTLHTGDSQNNWTQMLPDPVPIQDRGAGVGALPDDSWQLSCHLVEHQYWGRAPRRTGLSPVCCTPGLLRLWRLLRVQLFGASHPSHATGLASESSEDEPPRPVRGQRHKRRR